jgi:addiction module HigA family antidote
MRTIRDPKRKPTHPGEVLREDVLPALNMTQTEFAKRLSVSRLSVSELLLEKRAMTADMALRVAKLTRTTPESWLRMQEALDLWELERDAKRYRDIEPIAV